MTPHEAIASSDRVQRQLAHLTRDAASVGALVGHVVALCARDRITLGFMPGPIVGALSVGDVGERNGDDLVTVIAGLREIGWVQVSAGAGEAVRDHLRAAFDVANARRVAA